MAINFGEKFGCLCPKAGAHLRLAISAQENIAMQGARKMTSVTSKSALEYEAATELFGFLRANAYLRKK